jgi:hypothetical protein
MVAFKSKRLADVHSPGSNRDFDGCNVNSIQLKTIVPRAFSCTTVAGSVPVSLREPGPTDPGQKRAAIQAAAQALLSGLSTLDTTAAMSWDWNLGGDPVALACPRQKNWLGRTQLAPVRSYYFACRKWGGITAALLSISTAQC